MKNKEEILNGYKLMLREWHHLIKDINATEEEFVNDLIHRLDLIISQTREETIREVEGVLPEEAPPIIDILGTEEEYKHNEVIRARISGFNSCLGVVKEELNKLKN